MRHIDEGREPIPSVSPDLAVEVLSEFKHGEKLNKSPSRYFQSGTGPAWLGDPNSRTAAIYHEPDRPTCLMNENDLLDGEQVTPDFKLQLSEIFRGVPAK